MISTEIVSSFGSELRKLADAAPAPTGGPSHGAELYKKRVEARFGRLKKELKVHGDPVGTGHNRILIPKKLLSEDDLRKQLGFVPVNVAIPEAGQTRFQSFRHPGHNYHIHEHGDSWTMHEDRHAASTMLVKKWKMEQEAKRKAAEGGHSGKATGAKPKKPSKHEDSILKPVGDFVRGTPHIVTEGIPGAYYYAKGRITGTEDMADRVKAALPKEYNRRLGKWRELKKPGTTVTPEPKQASLCDHIHGPEGKCKKCGTVLLKKLKGLGLR